jgi:hypothetical protein
MQVMPAPQAPPPGAAAQDPGQEVAPPEQQWVYSYPSGQWVYTGDYGWVWVPAGSETTAMDGVPYTYLYTPGYGWTWYVSPWGWGPYHYGVWVRHPWRPAGWGARVWVAHPGISVRLGRPAFHAGVRVGVGVHAAAPRPSVHVTVRGRR